MSKRHAIALSIAVALGLSGEPARAADTAQACTVNSVTYNNNGASGKFLAIQCQEAIGTYFLAYISNPGTACPATDMDSVKLWQSMAAASKLSGKPLTVWWSLSPAACAGPAQKRIISAIDQ
jgi:hypothetical protein